MILGIPYADLEFVFYILIEQRFFIKRDSKIFDRINLMNVYALKFQGVKCLSRFLLPLKVIAVSLGNGANSGLLLLGMLLINILNKYGEKMSLCGKPFYGVWIVQKDSDLDFKKSIPELCFNHFHNEKWESLKYVICVKASTSIKFHTLSQVLPLSWLRACWLFPRIVISSETPIIL